MPGRSVLVVEDNPLNLKLARILLELEGFDVRTAVDAESALADLERLGPPDGALVDIQLPGMDGVELAKRIRETPALGNVVLVALTAYAMKGDEDRFLGKGFDAYIPKPIDQSTFGSRVSELLTSGRSKGEASS